MQSHNGHICLILHHCVFPQSALSDFHSVAILTWKRVWYFGTLHRYFNRTECLTVPIVSKICSQFYFQVSEHSKRPDGLLTQPRTAILFEANHNGSRPKDSLKKLTVGHQYFRQHLEKPKGSQYPGVLHGSLKNNVSINFNIDVDEKSSFQKSSKSSKIMSKFSPIHFRKHKSRAGNSSDRLIFHQKYASKTSKI